MKKIKSIQDIAPDQENLEEYKRFIQLIFKDIQKVLESGIVSVDKTFQSLAETLDEGLTFVAKFLSENFIPKENEADNDDEKDTKTDK